MASLNKIQGWVGYLGTKIIDLNGDTINVYLTNNTPSASADDVYADLAQISTGNGYSGPVDTQNTYSEATGTGSLAMTDVVVTASGSVGPFQYVPMYDDTPASTPTDPLMGWYDYGSALTLASGETFTLDFGSTTATLV